MRCKSSFGCRSRNPQPIHPEDIARIIRVLRGQRIILDTDLAAIYGTQTFRLNEAVKRNRERFPDDFLFQLTAEEWGVLTSQIAMSKASRGGRRTLPYAFTEHGALQAANILNSARAVAMSVYVIRAFIKMREELASNAAILKRLAEIEKELLIHDDALRDVYEQIRPLLVPLDPGQSPKEIGFHVKEDSIPYRIRRRSHNGSD
jgi:hypothetical protein